MLTPMNPVAELRAAVAALPHVPDTTPVEPTLAFGAPNALVFDTPNNVVRLSVGWGQATGRPTMGQLRAWLGLKSGTLAGPWDSARGLENVFTWRGALVFASALVSGYHGVKRNDGSAWWGLVWFTAGAVLPGLVPLIAVGQGYGRNASSCARPVAGRA